MNELKVYHHELRHNEYEEFYLKYEADKVIAELKDKCQMHDFFWEGCGFEKRGSKNTIAVSEEFDRIEAENERLRKENERLKEPSPQRWMAVTSPPKNMREVWVRTADGATIPGHYNYSKRVWYDHAAYNPVTAVGWQEVEPAGREEYALLEAENAQLKEAIAVYQRNEKFDIRDIRQLKRALWLMRANSAEGQFLYWCARFATESGFTKADIRGCSVNTKRKLRTIGEWIEIWKNVKLKAEEHVRTHYPEKKGA